MSRRTLRWTKRAVDRLDQIGESITRDNPEIAINVIAKIVSSVETLSDHPAFGRIGRVKGTRELVVNPYPYIVPYRVTSDSVEILTIIHAAQKWPEG